MAPKPPSNSPKGPLTWEAFSERLRTVYWPSLAPETRSMSRPNPPPDEPAVPDDIWQAAVTIFPDAENWLHNPVPSLGGKTPIQALGRGQTDQVKQLVMGVADFLLPDPDEVVPWDEEAVDAARAEAEGDSDAEDR